MATLVARGYIPETIATSKCVLLFPSTGTMRTVRLGYIFDGITPTEVFPILNFNSNGTIRINGIAVGYRPTRLTFITSS